MPAAAVIPAPIVYIKVAAVKKLVVGFRNAFASKPVLVAVLDVRFLALGSCPQGNHSSQSFTLKKIRVFKAGVTLPLNITAWDNKI